MKTQFTNIAPQQNDHIIEKVYVFCSVDEGGEGILGYKAGARWISLVTSKPELAEGMKALARQIGKDSGKKVVMKTFSLDSTEEI